MYASRGSKTLVAIFAIAGLTAVVLLTISLRGFAIFEPSGYRLYARFEGAHGLKTNSQVELNGVVVGRVVEVRDRDWRTYATLLIDRGTRVDRCATAGIKFRKDLLGAEFVSIASKQSAATLGANDAINGCRRVSAETVGAMRPTCALYRVRQQMMRPLEARN